MRTITYKKSFLDDTLKRVFVKNAESNDDNNITASMANDIEQATKSICVVFDHFLNDRFLQLLLGSTVPKYLIVPQIDEEKYARLSGQAVVHEVPNIKGNYCLIDDKSLYFFDPITFVGVKITDRDIISIVKQLFQKEFWVYTESEFIEKKLPMAEITFDLPPVYGSDKVLIDESFGETTPIYRLLENVETSAFPEKVDPTTKANTVILKDTKWNLDYLKTVDDATVLLCPQLPFSVLRDKNNLYILSFDSADYSHLETVGAGRLFAIQTADFHLGETYIFEKEKSLDELFEKKVLSMDGKEIIIHDRIEELRSVTVDLRVARELEKTDAEILEARLERLNNNIFKSSEIACSVNYTIELNIPKHKLSKLADIYEQYKDATRIMGDKVKELLCFDEDTLDKDDKKQLLRVQDKIPTLNKQIDLTDCVGAINQIIEKLNEKCEEKGMKKISVLKKSSIDRDLPRFGELYQEKQKYEYVLSDENQLDLAMAEMEGLGIQHRDVSYLLQ
jgi:hypothetical protein